MKKNIAWLKSAIQQNLDFYNDNDEEWQMAKVRAYAKSLDLINQLDEPEVLSQELPVIPKYVAEYLDFAKSDVPLMRVMELAKTRNEWPKWEKEYDWISANDEIFARAWLDGWKVEEEKVYEVKLEANGYGLTPSSLIVLYESVGGKIILREITKEHYDDSKRRVPNSYYLTEKQIKGYDERFWTFAEPVEEVEEC